MRVTPFMLAAFLSAATSAAQPPPSSPPRPDAPPPPMPGTGAAWCDGQIRPRHAGERPRAEARRLDELPPGDLYLTVWRRVDGCVGPVLVRQGYGGGQERRR